MFRAKLAVNAMTPMRFPRYLNRDPRDFFYLTLKSIIPGPDVTVDGKTIGFSTAGLPHAGWPYPFARVRIEETAGGRIWLVRIDPKRSTPKPIATRQQGRVLAYLSGVARQFVEPQSATVAPKAKTSLRFDAGEVVLLAIRESIGWKFAIGSPVESARVLFRAKPLLEGSTARAALGIDENGFWVYAERDRDSTGPTGTTLLQSLRQAGVTKALELPENARLLFFDEGQTFAVNGERGIRIDNDANLALIADEQPAAEVLFTDVKPMPYRNWGWMQNQRVRYFPTGPPRFPTRDSVK
jgi:hypothetical protein